MDVFLLVGQSNMAGRGDLPKDASRRSTNIYDNNGLFQTIINGHEILSFDTNNKWIPAKDPIHYDKPDKCGIGPALSFATLIAQLDIIDNNRKIGLIPCSIGGTSIKQWLPKNIQMDNDDTFMELNEGDCKQISDGIFEKTIKKTKLALTTAFDNGSKSFLKENGSEFDIELKAVLWHQGESDCDKIQNANNYLSAALLLFENMRKQLNNDNIPILVGGLADFLGQNTKNDNFIYYNIINKALMNIGQRLHNIAFVSSKGLTHKGDWLHFDSKSCQILGQRYAAKYGKLCGAMTSEEANKYMRFKNALKKHGKKAYHKTKGISVTSWLVGIAITALAIYSYKQYCPVASDKKQ